MHAHRHYRPAFLLLPLILGCGDARTDPALPVNPQQEAPTTNFDPATAGTIRGRVTWDGPSPEVKPFAVRSNLPQDAAAPGKLPRENPNAPRIDPDTRGVGNAVVFLRGVSAGTAKPWHHAPVRVEQRDTRLHIHQGDIDSPYGFVRRSQRVEMVSRDPVFHSLHAGGAAYFTLAFPDPNELCSRALNEKGLVELTSAAGYYWMRAYLFVDDHPYYSRTDAEGRYLLEQVPPGHYEIVCWLPNWLEARHELDLETCVMSRLFVRPPLEQTREATLKTHEVCEIQFSASLRKFEAREAR